MPHTETPTGAQAVVRALRLLKSFTPQAPELSLAQLCETQGLKKTTAHRLMTALESEGLVARDPVSNSYRLGPEVIALGSQALLTSDLRAEVRPALERLAEQTGESATLEVLIGDQMLILDGVRGRHLVAASLELGSRWPAFATSTGRCVLAWMPESARAQVLQQPMTAFTRRTLTEAAQLRAEFVAIRARGYAIADQELEEDHVAVAAEFRGQLGEVRGAISVGGPASRFTPERIQALGAQLRAEADKL
jgi:DNA-binding IclR family transcriptional regulator